MNIASGNLTTAKKTQALINISASDVKSNCNSDNDKMIMMKNLGAKSANHTATK
jgi:hypothetical protein